MVIKNIIMVGEFSLTQFLLMSDLVVSDTSSAIYEALLMDKPVITLNAISKDLYWKNITDASPTFVKLTMIFLRIKRLLHFANG